MSEKKKRQLAQLNSTTSVNPWGYFQFVGVEPGAYRVVARQPGYLDAVQPWLQLEGAGDTEIENTLVLRPPAHLSVLVIPAEGPRGQPWELRLHESSGAEVLDEVAADKTGPVGEWSSPPLRKGLYVLEVLDASGNRALWREIDLEGGSNELTIELPLVLVEGRVRLGGSPLEATVWFGGRTGAERVEAQSDEHGEIYAVLPHGGEWTVDVRADDPMVLSRGLALEIEPDDEGTAEALIEVPDTTVSGDVVDGLGLPVPSATVRLISHGQWRGLVATSTGPLGQFEVHGVRTGPYLVEAAEGDRRSEPTRLSVEEEQEQSVQLILQRDRPMAGRIVSGSGPVPEALVMAYPATLSGQLATAWLPETRTRIDGRFDLRVPGSTSRVRLVVMAPGYAFKLKEVAEGERLEVALSQEGGTLRLVEGEGRDGDGSVGVVFVGGEPIDVPKLTTWAQMNGVALADEESIDLPAMPPGQYSYCRIRTDEAILVLGEAAVPVADSCASGYLPVGGELTLEAPR